MDAIDDVCRLARASGDRSGGRRPKNYPESLFSRFATAATAAVAPLVVQRLMSDDVYSATPSFPAPEHRSARLAAQASMRVPPRPPRVPLAVARTRKRRKHRPRRLYVVLYFVPDALKRRKSAMREAVDRHFSDNWVIPIYMGHVVDLSVEWAPYPAARAALGNVLSVANAGALASANDATITSCLARLKTYLTEGVLTEQFLLDNLRPLLDCVRDANAALRWRLLHRRCADTAHRNAARGAPGAPGDADGLTTLLLEASQLEYRLRRMVGCLLDTKAAKWAFCRQQVVNRMSELADYFSGDRALARASRDDSLSRWFARLAVEAGALEPDERAATLVGHKIATLIAALEEVEQFEQVDTNLQIKAFLADAREFLAARKPKRFEIPLPVALRNKSSRTLSPVVENSGSEDERSEKLRKTSSIRAKPGDLE